MTDKCMPILSTLQYVSIIGCSNLSKFKATASYGSQEHETGIKHLDDTEQLKTPVKYLGLRKQLKKPTNTTLRLPVNVLNQKQINRTLAPVLNP